MLGVALSADGQPALPALRRAAELLPADAEAQRNLGFCLQDQGQLPSALESLRRSLALDPRNLEALMAAGDCARALGAAQTAAELYRRALAEDPSSVEASNNLGNAYLQLGRPDEAAQHYRLALGQAPERAEIHANLANAQRQLGQLEASLASSRRALSLAPELVMAHNNLGLVLTGLGRRSEAIGSFRRALELDPQSVETMANLAAALHETGQRREALALLQRAVELHPERADAWRHLGDMQLEIRQIDAAIASYRRVIAIQPDDTQAMIGTAAALRLRGQHAEAQSQCRSALHLDPRNAAGLLLQAELLADAGRFAEAEQLYRQSLESDPRQAYAYYSMAIHRRMTREDVDWLRGAESLLSAPLPLRHGSALRYALGKYHDDIGEYDAAFAHFRQANELSRQYGAGYDALAVEMHTDDILRSFGPESIRSLQAHADPSERPLFILGMPRSGTTLAEQILSAHPDVFGAGELAYWERALQVFESSDPAVRVTGLIPTIAKDYLHRIAALSDSARRVIDKRPMNFMAAGLIHAVFPRARIIHLRRDPIDTCLSIYFNFLPSIHNYANDLGHLAHFFGQYLRLTAHWRSVLPAHAYLEVPYESLVTDQETWSRRMVEFAGLPWDDRCLNFDRADRVVITLSKWQVRQKMSTASAGRWRHYEKYLGPLMPLIDLAAR